MLDRSFEALPLLKAPARLKSRIYSALLAEQAPLLPLAETQDVCVFERLVQIAPVGQALQSRNYCSVCHARWLAERLENPPIFWSNCPYVDFKNS